MLCILGDLTNDPQHYKRAWVVSNNHSARAQRALGLYHLRKEEYRECIESLQLSLNVNAMQVGMIADYWEHKVVSNNCLVLDPIIHT